MAKIIFIQDVLFDFHSIECLSAVLKKSKHEADVFILAADRGDYLDYVRKARPDYVGFSVSSTDYGWAVDVAQRIKKRLGIATVFGGPHPTYFPEFIENPNVDIICIGEGEYALLELMDKTNRGADITSIKNLYVKKDGEVFKNDLRPLMDLKDLPMPDRGLYFRYPFLRKTPTKRLTPTRGCPYNCSYCYNQNYRSLYKGKGVYVRFRPVESIISELMFIREHARLKFVSFVADTFTSNKQWLGELLEQYRKKIDLPFFCQAEANEVDETVVQKLKQSRCRYFSFGIESGNERIRTEILNKKISNNQIRYISGLLKKHSIPFCTFNMFCFPAETLNEAFETVSLNAEIGADVVSGTVLQPTVGTQLYDYVKEHDLFVDDYDTGVIAGHYQESPLKIKHKKEILNLQKLFYIGVKFPWTVPLLRILIKLPSNPLFALVLKITLFIRYKKTRSYSLLDMLKTGWHLRKYV